MQSTIPSNPTATRENPTAKPMMVRHVLCITYQIYLYLVHTLYMKNDITHLGHCKSALILMHTSTVHMCMSASTNLTSWYCGGLRTLFWLVIMQYPANCGILRCSLVSGLRMPWWHTATLEWALLATMPLAAQQAARSCILWATLCGWSASLK